MKYKIILLILILLTTGCIKDKPKAKIIDTQVSNDTKVIVKGTGYLSITGEKFNISIVKKQNNEVIKTKTIKINPNKKKEIIFKNTENYNNIKFKLQEIN